MAGLALGQRGKQRGEKERKEGQASILGVGLCLEPIVKVQKGNCPHGKTEHTAENSGVIHEKF